MAEMALGYGSEFQLLRFLGHHRNYLNAKISDVLKIDSDIYWLDYPEDYSRVSCDGEYDGVSCFNSLNSCEYSKILNLWKDYWPQQGKPQTWDGIFKVNDTWFFVEAKAHKNEIKSDCKSTDEQNKIKIQTAFDESVNMFKSTKTGIEWLNCCYYQLANRLAFVNFCTKIGIKAKILYLYFINGFDKPETDGELNIKTVDQWKSIWQNEYKELGLVKENLQDVVFHVYIDCFNLNNK